MRITKKELKEIVEKKLSQCESSQDLKCESVDIIVNLLCNDKQEIDEWKVLIRNYAFKDENIEIVDV